MKIFVPTDFSAITANAADHALNIAQQAEDSEVTLLHIIDKESQRKAAEKKMQAELDRIAGGRLSEIVVHALIRVGDIFVDIPREAEANNADLVVMGTHGMKGLQHVFGSHALKVVTGSKVPFIITQSRECVEHSYKNIVVPIDLSQETKQQLRGVVGLAKVFNSTIHIYYPTENDTHFKNKVLRNVSYTKQFLLENEIFHTVKASPKATGSTFLDDLINYAEKRGAGLITVLYEGNAVMGLFGNAHEQKMITNDHGIPVLVLNPAQSKIYSRKAIHS